jgi:hypothetical protein
MRLDAGKLLVPLLAALILILTLRQTMSALKSSGSWQGRPRAARVRAEDPYARLDHLLARPLVDAPPDRVRDPFGYGPSPAPVAGPRVAQRPRTPPAPPRPNLTAIIWDNDPRATIRYADQNYSVRENSLFADFRVKSITRTQVVLERNGEPLVLTLSPKGE